MDSLLKLALETIQLHKQAIIFLPSRASAEKTAEDLSAVMHEHLPALEHEVLKVVSSPTKQCRRLSHCVKKGVAFHHSGLTTKQKELIEDGFRRSEIKIICATPTLAAGVSLPAYRVLIKSLRRFSGTRGMDWIPVLEYLQMAGRAGRPEYEKEGQAIVIAKDEEESEEIYEQYICGEPEEIYSKLAVEPVLRTYLLSLIASGIIHNEQEMMGFFSKTFWAHQFQDLTQLQEKLARMLSFLTEGGFVTASGDNTKNTVATDFVSAASLAPKMSRTTVTNLSPEHTLKATALGKRVSELYLDPLTAQHLLKCLRKYSPSSTPFSLLQMICHTLELRPLLSVKKREEAYIIEELNKHITTMLEEEPSIFDEEYEVYLNSIKTALFFEDWIQEREEEYLLEKHDIRPGEIKVKLESAEWLLYASQEIASLHQLREAEKAIQVLRIRVENGVKEELLPLLKLRGIGRIRARKLFTAGIKDVGDIKKTDPTTLGQIIGRAIAEDVKKQVGEEIDVIPKGTRKGQLSLMKFNV
ncbi:hypothetical protein HY496_01325 [Candidatus Woesearchaeota archaeon]|nr:hypothetical protein [Candidatus Woesearchaeota archaeon]